MRAVALTLLCALTACEIDVDLGNDELVLDAGIPSTPVPVVCPPRVDVAAYRVTVDPTPLTNPSCWADGGLPPDAGLPLETFDALIVQGSTLGITGLATQQLGDAPAITVGSAFAGNATRFEWTTQSGSLREEIRTQAIFSFDRIDTRETAGTIALSASGLGRSCAVIRSFRAVAIDASAAWTLATPELAGAKPYVAVIDLGSLSRTDATCGAPLVRTPTLRAIEVWQIAWPLARIPPRSIALTGAPTVELESDFGPSVQRHVSERDAGVDAKETRSTEAQLVLPCMNATPALELSSRYECTGAGCAALTPDDAGTCAVRIPYSAFAL